MSTRTLPITTRKPDGVIPLPKTGQEFSLTYPLTGVDPSSLMIDRRPSYSHTSTIFHGKEVEYGKTSRFVLLSFPHTTIKKLWHAMNKEDRMYLLESSLWGEAFRQRYAFPPGVSSEYSICFPTAEEEEWCIGAVPYFLTLRRDTLTRGSRFSPTPNHGILNPTKTHWLLQLT